MEPPIIGLFCSFFAFCIGIYLWKKMEVKEGIIGVILGTTGVLLYIIYLMMTGGRV